MRTAIIGGGISGLTTALSLYRLGIDCKVYEKAPELKPVGAGIWMQPNALKVLDWLGVGAQVRANGTALYQVDISNQMLRPFRKTNNSITRDSAGNNIISIHRARLQNILAESLPPGMLETNKSYESHQLIGDSVSIKFTDGVTEADILLGADGIHSKVRASIFPDSTIRYSGQTCWRGVAAMQLPKEFTSTGREAWGKGVRFGFSQVSDNQVYWFGVVKAPQNQKDVSDNLKQKIVDLFPDFHPLVKEIIAKTDESVIIRSDLSDLIRLDHWSSDRVCLMGDAAHATTPNMGQGGGQGIEDAWYLSNLLAISGNHAEAFFRFEQLRRKKVDYIVNTSHQLGKMAHSFVGQSFLKLIMKITPERIMQKQMQKLFDVQEVFV
jgi:2-polyprenyl-6-methoxyphenol hydroxylase-like FAD-dependent oxidoreductase